MIKCSLHQENKTIINIYTPKNKTPNIYETKIDNSIEVRNSSTKIVGDVKAPLSIMDRTTRQKINRETELNNTVTN